MQKTKKLIFFYNFHVPQYKNQYYFITQPKFFRQDL